MLGAVIAGGASHRFGGDKAAALLGTMPLIDHVITALTPQVDALVIVGRGWRDHPKIEDHPFRCGPLSGLCAALRRAHQLGHADVLTAGCDVLPLPADLAVRLGGDGPAVVAGQRLFGRWPSALCDVLEAHIRDQDDHSLRHWVAVSSARTVRFDTVFHNLNTAGDLEKFARAKIF